MFIVFTPEKARDKPPEDIVARVILFLSEELFGLEPHCTISLFGFGIEKNERLARYPVSGKMSCSKELLVSKMDEVVGSSLVMGGIRSAQKESLSRV